MDGEELARWRSTSHDRSASALALTDTTGAEAPETSMLKQRQSRLSEMRSFPQMDDHIYVTAPSQGKLREPNPLIKLNGTSVSRVNSQGKAWVKFTCDRQVMRKKMPSDPLALMRREDRNAELRSERIEKCATLIRRQ